MTKERHGACAMILDGLKPIKDVGFIIRTAGIGKIQGEEIERDLKYLTRLWENIQKRCANPPPSSSTPRAISSPAPCAMRTAPISSRIVVDNLDVAKRIQEVIKIAMPEKSRPQSSCMTSPVPLFHQANIERGNRPDVQPARAAALRRIAGDRFDRSRRRDRRQQRQKPRKQRRRDDRLQNRHGSRRRNSPPAQTPRSGRRDHLRFHRSALRAPSPRAGRTPVHNNFKNDRAKPKCCA